MLLNPGAAAATGAVAGAIATYGFSFATPALKRLGLTDTCGILNLHFLPGLLGGAASAIAAAGIDTGGAWPEGSVAAAFPGRGGRSALAQGGYQAAATVISAAWGAGAGALAAWLLRGEHAALEGKRDDFYEDAGLWNVPADAGEEAPEVENAVALRLAREKKLLGALRAGSKSRARARARTLTPPSPRPPPNARSGGDLQGRERGAGARAARAQGAGAGAGGAGDAGAAAGARGGAQRQQQVHRGQRARGGARGRHAEGGARQPGGGGGGGGGGGAAAGGCCGGQVKCTVHTVHRRGGEGGRSTERLYREFTGSARQRKTLYNN